jgi:hypothetical protein
MGRFLPAGMPSSSIFVALSPIFWQSLWPFSSSQEALMRSSEAETERLMNGLESIIEKVYSNRLDLS